MTTLTQKDLKRTAKVALKVTLTRS